MKIKKGIAASPGVVIAPAVVIDAEEYEVPRREVPPDLWQQELARLAKACSQSKAEILDLRDRTAKRIGMKVASIFDFHVGLMEDKELQQKFQAAISEQHVAAEYAVQSVLRAYAMELQSLPAYFADRVREFQSHGSSVHEPARVVIQFGQTQHVVEDRFNRRIASADFHEERAGHFFPRIGLQSWREPPRKQVSRTLALNQRSSAQHRH